MNPNKIAVWHVPPPFHDFSWVLSGYKIKQPGRQSVHRKLLGVTSNTCVIYINYSNTTKNNILFIDVLASCRKPSSGLTSSGQYVKACPIRGFMLLVFLIHIASLMSLPALSDSRSITLVFAQSNHIFSLQT